MSKEKKEDKVNASNQLDPEELKKIFPACKFGYRFRFAGIIDKNVEVLRLLLNSTLKEQPTEPFFQSVLTYTPDLNFAGIFFYINF